LTGRIPDRTHDRLPTGAAAIGYRRCRNSLTRPRKEESFELPVLS
jgi:hypothetical protein